MQAKLMVHLPCVIKCIDKSIKTTIKNASGNLKVDGFKHKFNNYVSNDEPLFTSLAKAVTAVKKLMIKLNHRLYRGSIYVKIKKG